MLRKCQLKINYVNKINYKSTQSDTTIKYLLANKYYIQGGARNVIPFIVHITNLYFCKSI